MNDTKDTTWIDPFQKNAEIHERYNRHRIEYLRACLSEKKRDVLDLIPVLLHEQGVTVPGHEITESPIFGISTFSYTHALTALAARYFGGEGFRPQQTVKSRLSIVFLALMGSAGTVAFTKESDLDFWVGIETEKHNEADLDFFREKLRSIEQWAGAAAGLEAHFFLADLTRIRTDNYGEVSEQSCGSALGKLLKDEFYRTGMFLEGKRPFYWLMPPGAGDAVYRRNVAALSTSAVFAHRNYVDLGNVSTIRQAEYFGAAIWQLLKGLRTPLKSVVKMALLDKYSSEGSAAVPLCELFKEEIGAAARFDTLDPYLFLIEALRSFCTRVGLTSERRLLEGCFLIRNLLSAQSLSHRDNERVQFFVRLAGQWKWSEEETGVLCRYSQWDRFQRDELRTRIIGYLVDTYKRIRARTREAGARLSERDLTVVGKKLVSFFGQEKGKVPFEFSLLQARDICAIDVREHREKHQHFGWTVELKSAAKQRTQVEITREVDSPIVAAAWCSLNQFYNGRQQFGLRGKTSLTVKELLNLVTSFDRFFPRNEVESMRVDDLLDERHITHLYVVPAEDDPHWAEASGSMLVFLRNTMGELFYEHYDGEAGLAWLTREILEKRIGASHMQSLTWSVHRSRGQATSGRRIGDMIGRCVAEFIADAARFGRAAPERKALP